MSAGSQRWQPRSRQGRRARGIEGRLQAPQHRRSNVGHGRVRIERFSAKMSCLQRFPSYLARSPRSDTSSELQGASFSNEKLVRVRRRGFQVRARVGCPEGAVESCKITLLFKSNVNTRLLASRAARAAKKNVTLGKRKLNVPAGRDVDSEGRAVQAWPEGVLEHRHPARCEGHPGVPGTSRAGCPPRGRPSP